MCTFPSNWDWHKEALSLPRSDSLEAVAGWDEDRENDGILCHLTIKNPEAKCTRKVAFNDFVEERVYEVDTVLRRKKKPIIIQSRNWGEW